MSLINNFPRFVWYPVALLITALACLVFVFAWKALFAKDIEANVCGNDIKIHNAVYETVKSLQEVLKVEAAYKAANLSATKNHCMSAKRTHKRDGENLFCDPDDLEALSHLLDKEQKGLEKVDTQLEQLQVQLESRKMSHGGGLLHK